MHTLEQLYAAVLPRLTDSTQKQASEKVAADWATFSLIKQAGPFSRALLTGAGFAIPTGLVGAGLLHYGQQQSEKTLESLRNKALQTALGVGAIGTGLYALHRRGEKTSAARMNDAAELLEKIATTGFLDAVWEHAEVPTEKRAQIDHYRLLNASHSIDLFTQLLSR